jgi:hypothetical protein
MSDASDLANSIRSLADPHPTKRSTAGAQIHRLAADLCQPIVRQWAAHSAFRELLVGSTRDRQTPFVAGIAVLPETFEQIRAANGTPRLADVPPDQDAIEFELPFGGHILLDVLTSRDPDAGGAIARYLRKFGEGIQQVEIYVTDVDRATEILRRQFNLAPIYGATRLGADRTRVNFFLAEAPHGNKVLIELVEPGVDRS